MLNRKNVEWRRRVLAGIRDDVLTPTPPARAPPVCPPPVCFPSPFCVAPYVCHHTTLKARRMAGCSEEPS